MPLLCLQEIVSCFSAADFYLRIILQHKRFTQKAGGTLTRPQYNMNICFHGSFNVQICKHMHMHRQSWQELKILFPVKLCNLTPSGLAKHFQFIHYVTEKSPGSFNFSGVTAYLTVPIDIKIGFYNI